MMHDLKNCTITAATTYKMKCNVCGLMLETPYSRENALLLFKGDIGAQNQREQDAKVVKKQFMEHECDAS